MIRRSPLAALVLAAAIAALAAGCGGGSSTGGGGPEATITANWETFFKGSTDATTRIGLLENGQDFASLIRSISANPLSKTLSAKVGKVDVTDPNTAKVTYTLYLGKNAVLKNASGDAVRQNGTWKVGDASFCQLLALEGASPPACKASSK